MRIGVDIDGVLADFNTSFIERCINVTGRDLFPARPFDIPTWNYPEHYGYTAGELKAIWASIKTSRTFWRSLAPYGTTCEALVYLNNLMHEVDDDVYFVTARPGLSAKYQTESWLNQQDDYENVKTVLISSHKGLCARALDLDIYIDDKWENCIDVRDTSPKTKVFLMDRPWNRYTRDDGSDASKGLGITRVSSVVGICGSSPVVVDFVARSSINALAWESQTS